MSKWEPCPRCGSNRVKSMGMFMFVLLGLGLISFGLIFTLFFPIIGIPLLAIGVLFLIISPFTKNTLQCEDCKKSWKYPSSQTQNKTV